MRDFSFYDRDSIGYLRHMHLYHVQFHEKGNRDYNQVYGVGRGGVPYVRGSFVNRNEYNG